MATRDSTPKPNPWDESTATAPVDAEHIAKLNKPLKAETPELEYDLEGLMNDFPTAKELERFVYDETGIVLNLKGRQNKLKYEIAKDVLNGAGVDDKFLGKDNPYLDKSDLVPVDPIKPAPDRGTGLPPVSEIQNSFHSRMIPHVDEDLRAKGRHVHITFRKYSTGDITFEVLGPIDEKPVGEKIDKYGRTRPEIITWVDPRTGEQLAQRPDGTLTPQGKKLRALMRSDRFRVNKSNQWDVWIDRDFIQDSDSIIRNPWDTGSE